MKDLVIGLVCVVGISSVIGLFFEEKEEISKYVKLVASLCFICILIPGGIKFFKDLKMPDAEMDYEINDYEEFVENYKNAVIDNAKTELEQKLSGLIFQNFGINPDNIDIQFNVTRQNEMTTVHIKSINIVFRTTDKNAQIKEYVREMCEVIPEISVVNEGGEDV